MSIAEEDPLFAALLRTALQARAPAVVVEVALDDRFDRARGRWCGCLRIRLVLAAPGHSDSRYRELYLDTLPGEGEGELRASLAIVRGLAQRLDIGVHPPGEPVSGGPRWIDLQGPPPTRSWRFRWRTLAWREDGSEVAAEGECSVDADRGEQAVQAVGREVRAGLTPPYRLTLESAELGPVNEPEHTLAYPGGFPPMNTLRAWMVEERSISAVLRRSADTAARPIERMVALAEAFCLDLRELAPVCASLAGGLADAAVDAALAPALARTVGQWSLPVRLEEALAHGRPVGPVLHEYHRQHGLGVLYLIKAMREAFGLSLMTAKTLVDIACTGERDDELDAALPAMVAAIRAGERDDRAALYAALDTVYARRR